MKPFGAGVHAKEGTVNYSLVKWLCLGSVPSAFAGVLLLNAIGGDDVADTVKLYLGIALADGGGVDGRPPRDQPAARPAPAPSTARSTRCTSVRSPRCSSASSAGSSSA